VLHLALEELDFVGRQMEGSHSSAARGFCGGVGGPEPNMTEIRAGFRVGVAGLLRVFRGTLGLIWRKTCGTESLVDRGARGLPF